MNLIQFVAGHIVHGSLRERSSKRWSRQEDLDHLIPADLAPLDEFHIGGRQATIDFADQFEIRPGLGAFAVGTLMNSFKLD